MTTQNESITCPKCGHQFAVAEALAEQIRNTMQAEMQKEVLQREKELAEQKMVLEGEAMKLVEVRGNIDAQVESRLKEKLSEAEKKAALKIGDEYAVRLGEMQQALEERKKQVDEFRQQELVLRQKQRELEEGKAALELDVVRRLEEEREKMRNEVSTKIQEEHRRKDLEKDKVINDLKTSLDDMKRKAEQGSMETQGEVLEQDLEDQLRHFFPYDEFRAIKKGERGADLVQTVHNNTGGVCGTILWEAKNAKLWGKEWIQKLKDDMMREKAAIGILCSVAPCEGIVRFGLTDGVWISDPTFAIPMAASLRQQLIAVEFERAAATGKNEKIEMVYRYIAGAEFRQRLESIVDAFTAMSRQLFAEKVAMGKQWAEREKQIQRVVTNTTGLYGDFCGLIGGAVPVIPALQLDEGAPKEIEGGQA